MASIIFEERVEVPLDCGSLADFRRWAVSDLFPEQGRIDYIAGKIEVDMSPEELHAHAAVKVELVGALRQIVKEDDIGELFTDSTRVVSLPADLSAEPDVLFIRHASIDEGRVRYIPKTGRQDRFIEIEGSPDMVAEIVSDASVGKDTRRLPAAYYTAGVEEFWLIDARHDDLRFQIHRRGPEGFEPVTPDSAGYQPSAVFQRRFRLDRSRNRRGHWQYDLNFER